MKLRNGIRKMAALLLAGALTLTAAQGMCVSAGENTEELEISLWQEEDHGESAVTAEAVPEDDVLLQDEVTEDFGDPQGITLSGEGEEAEPFSGTVSEDILIEDINIVEDPSGGADGFVESADVWDVSGLHRTGLASDASSPVSLGGVSAISGTVLYDGCYGNQLAGEARKIYDTMKKVWRTNQNGGKIVYELSEPARIVIKGLYDPQNSEAVGNSEEYKRVIYEVTSAANAFLHDYPEVFWTYGVSYSTAGSSSYDGSVTTLTIEEVTLNYGEEYYEGARDDIARFNSAVDRACAEIRAGLPAASSRYAVVKAIHDYVCGRVDYNLESPYAHTVAGFFLYPEQGVVCEGYAKAFKILCDRFGIECALISGYAVAGGDGGPHMWNNVRMDDNVWYLVDATWDDQGQIMDTYFLAGSMTEGFEGDSVASERTIYKNLSGGSNVQEFEVPVLSMQKYSGCSHTWQEDPERTKAPSCEEDGETGYVCSKCGSTKAERIPASGHAWGPWTTVKEATVLKTGTQSRSCSVCGETRTQKIPKVKGTIKLNVSGITLRVNQSTKAVKVTGMAQGDSVLSWKSSSPKIVTVNAQGKITGKRVGSAKITVTLKSGVSASIKVVVQKTAVKTTGILVAAKKGTIKNKRLTLKKGGNDTLVVTLNPITSEDKISYSSSDSRIVGVNAKGKITGKKAGKAKITVKAGKKKAVIVVTVK